MAFLKQRKKSFAFLTDSKVVFSDIDAESINTYRQKIRQRHTDDVWKETLVNGEVTFVQFKKYTFISPINHGLARQFGVLPAEIPFRIRFHRAPAEFGLLKFSENVSAKKKSAPNDVIQIPFTYEERVIPILNPILKCFYAYGPALSQKMSQIASYAFELDFMHYECRQTIFDTALSEYKVNLGQGPLPKYIIFALSSVQRSRGNAAESITHFEQLGIAEFDLLLSK